MPAPSHRLSSASAPVVVGLVEAVGQLKDRELFVSGWAKQPPSSGAVLRVISAEGAATAQWFATWTDRPDVGPGTGFSGILKLSAPMLADAVRAVQVSAGMVLGVYEKKQILDVREATARLRRGVRSSSTTPAALADAASRYDGTDTVATSPLPIRLGIDDAVALEGGCVLLSGWLFDPEELVRQVDLTAGLLRTSISDSWVTRRRPDVLAAVCAEERFAPYAAKGDFCGFTALLPGATDVEDVHVTLVTRSTALHAPVQPRRGQAPTLLGGLLRGLDPDLSSSAQIAEEMVAPVLAAIPASRPAILHSDLGDINNTATLTTIVGCWGDSDDIDGLLAVLAMDPVARRSPILVAGPAIELAGSEREIRQRAEFFGLHVGLVGGTGVNDHVDALVLGALASHAEIVCLLASDITPITVGWLERLAKWQNGRSSVVVPSHFDQAAFGAHESQRERSRIRSGADCCLAPRQSVIDAYDLLGTRLSRASKAQDLLTLLSAAGERIEAADVDVLKAIVPNAERLLMRADRAAAAIRLFGKAA